MQPTSTRGATTLQSGEAGESCGGMRLFQKLTAGRLQSALADVLELIRLVVLIVGPDHASEVSSAIVIDECSSDQLAAPGIQPRVVQAVQAWAFQAKGIGRTIGKTCGA